ncbi:hypothetical protein CVT26_009029 [Gymnopilus dilepis]|uniref:Uncharacterized protein n=1 Tax=Gymnopilus dilepis TaxID=231916 RepID=A0A409YB93_9AGAR|nr:hypothetical protein CVT26_009029 [Gymnopilus dilepis]
MPQSLACSSPQEHCRRLHEIVGAEVGEAVARRAGSLQRRWQKDVMSTLDLQNMGGASPKAIVTKDYIGLPILHLVFSALLVSGTFRVILNKRDFTTAFVLFAKYAYTLADPVVIYQYMQHHVPGPTFGSCYRRLGGALALAEGTEAEAVYFCRIVTGPVQALMIVGYLVGFAIMIISIPLMLADDDSIGVDLPQSSRTGSGTSAPVSIEDGADNPHEKEIQPEQSQ